MNYFHLIDKEDAVNAIVNLTNCENAMGLAEYCARHGLEDRWIGGLVDAINAVMNVSSVMIADERLVPKKPHTTFVPYFYKRDETIVQCPNCKRRLRTSRTVKNPDAYCPRCGQAIDWSEVE